MVLESDRVIFRPLNALDGSGEYSLAQSEAPERQTLLLTDPDAVLPPQEAFL